MLPRVPLIPQEFWIHLQRSAQVLRTEASMECEEIAMSIKIKPEQRRSKAGDL